MKLILGNSEEKLKELVDNSVDSIITDPPYGLSKEPNIAEVMQHWINGDDYKHGSVGFMQRDWDSFVPNPSIWKECLRVLKPGGIALVFAGTRTQDLMSISLRFAGFEIRDSIRHFYSQESVGLSWIFGSGFPKSHNISKQLDKMAETDKKTIEYKRDKNVYFPKSENETYNPRTTKKKHNNFFTAPSTPGAKEWEGWGTALKPAYEPIIVAMKPLDGTYAENALKWGVAGINIDGSRVGKDTKINSCGRTGKNPYQSKDEKLNDINNIKSEVKGRFPANVLLSHSPGCVKKGVKKVGSGKATGYDFGNSKQGNVSIINNIKSCEHYGTEIVENWQCVDGCPIKLLDEQSGILKSGGSAGMRQRKAINTWGGVPQNYPKETSRLPDSGGASRFFKNFAPFMYAGKASKRERNEGCEGIEKKIKPMENQAIAELKRGNDPQKTIDNNSSRFITKMSNYHPTVKSLKIMEYLCNLTKTPTGGVVLDPFMGSGTTGVACINTDRDFIGIEMNAEYFKIAKVRIEYAEVKTKKENNQLVLF